jgi:hypothetical protein
MSKHREIYLVEVMERPMDPTDPAGKYRDPHDPDEQQIAVFRRRVGEECAPRLYRPYRYRSGLRYQRLLRILGRHERQTE